MILNSKEAQPLEKTQLRQAQVGRALLVVNAKSRQGRENFQRALQELQAQGINLIDAQAVSDPKLIKLMVEKVVAAGKVDSVLVGGGDGTVSAIAGVLAHRPVCLGLLPMGTANDFARNLKIETDIKQAVSIIKAGYVLPIDLGYAGDRCFLNVASIGLGVSVARNMDSKLKKWIGPLAYGVAAFKAVTRLRPVHVQLSLPTSPDGDPPQVAAFKAIQITVANGHYYGGGMVSAPDAQIADHELTVTVIEMMSFFELLKLAPGLRDGSYVKQLKVHYYSTKEVRVETRHSHRVNLDGEICQRTPLHFQVSPAALNVFAPQS